MKTLALLFRVNGVDHVLVDSVNPGNVEERHRFMLSAFPENRARLVSVELVEECADTLRPEADPFSTQSIRATLDTLDESPTLESRDRRENRKILGER
jgi:hypothetical protein